jgi:hypothetical protein
MWYNESAFNNKILFMTVCVCVCVLCLIEQVFSNEPRSQIVHFMRQFFRSILSGDKGMKELKERKKWCE